MKELPWKDYRGETIQQIIALKGRYRIDSLVVAVNQALQMKPATDITHPEFVVLAVEELDRRVNGDGFDGFLRYGETKHVLEAAACLREIGCPKFAFIAEKAVSLIKVPEDFRGDCLEDLLTEEICDQLEEYDEQFYKYPESIEQKLFEFIERNADKIALPEAHSAR